MDVTEKLKKLRKSNGISQDAMAQIVGVTKGTYFKWEKGDNLPSAEGALRIAEHFNISLDELFGRITSQGEDDNESVVLNAYRRLDAQSQAVVLTLLLRLSQEEANEGTLQRR